MKKQYETYGGNTIKLLREDEIEALLKFDGAKLLVTFRDDLLIGALVPYTAVIKYKKLTLARGGSTRIKAVRDVWEVYKQYIETPEDMRKSGDWLYENAMGDVELQLRKIIKEKHNGKD